MKSTVQQVLVRLGVLGLVVALGACVGSRHHKPAPGHGKKAKVVRTHHRVVHHPARPVHKPKTSTVIVVKPGH